MPKNKNKIKDIIVVNVGSQAYPAQKEDIDNAENIFRAILANKDLAGVTHHEISVKKISLKDKRKNKGGFLIKVGSPDKIATPDDVAYFQDKWAKAKNNVFNNTALFVVPHDVDITIF